MTNKEAIRILRNAAFLATSTSYQAVEEAVGVAVKAMTSATDTNVATKDGDMVYRQDVLDALDEIESEVADGDGFQYEKWRKHFCEMTSARPDHIADDSKRGDTINRKSAIEALHDEIVSRRISEDTNDDGALDEFDTEAILRRLPSAQPEQLTDNEKRIFLAAMTREELICLQLDEEFNDPNLVNLVEICHEITRKVKDALWMI